MSKEIDVSVSLRLVSAFSDIENVPGLYKEIARVARLLSDPEILKREKEKIYIEWAREQDLMNGHNFRSQPKEAEPPKKAFVYLMLNRRNGFIKIGRAKNPQFREQTLQSEEPEIEMIFNALGVESDEIELHKRFAGKRIRGEWFRLTEQDVSEIKEFFNEKQRAN